MNRKYPIAVIAGWLALAAAPASAQTVPAAAPAPAAPSTNAETITLSPFTVTSDKDEGYAASSSLAGSRVRTDLAILPRRSPFSRRTFSTTSPP